MAAGRLSWDVTGEHLYKTGIDHGVIYDFDETTKKYTNGEAWNGLTGFTKSPSGAEETKLFADNKKYLSLRSAEDFGATITCYTYPKLFEEKNGSKELVPGMRVYQQARKSFGLCVRTLVGNDTDTNDYGFELHLCYGLTASPSEEDYNTVNDSPEAIEFSYELASIPVAVTNAKPTAVVTIDSKPFETNSEATGAYAFEGKYYTAEFGALLDKLYGTGTAGEQGATVAELPLPDVVKTILTGGNVVGG